MSRRDDFGMGRMFLGLLVGALVLPLLCFGAIKPETKGTKLNKQKVSEAVQSCEVKDKGFENINFSEVLGFLSGN